ncbi:MAG: hypothetical protein AAFV53_21135 [Myxococcota bacterium]
MDISSQALSIPERQFSNNAALLGWRIVSEAVFTSWYTGGDVFLWGHCQTPLLQIQTAQRPLGVSVTDALVIVRFSETVGVYRRDDGRRLGVVSVPGLGTRVYPLLDGRLIIVVRRAEPQEVFCFSPEENRLRFLFELPLGDITTLGSGGSVLGVQDDHLYCFVDTSLIRINLGDVTDWTTLLECADEPAGAVISGQQVLFWNEENDVISFHIQRLEARALVSFQGRVMGCSQRGEQLLLWTDSNELWCSTLQHAVTDAARHWQIIPDGKIVGLDALGRMILLHGDERRYALFPGGPVEQMAVWGDRILVQQGEFLSAYANIQVGATPVNPVYRVGVLSPRHRVGVCVDGTVLDIGEDALTVRFDGAGEAVLDEVFFGDGAVMSRVGRCVSVCRDGIRASIQTQSAPERVVLCGGVVVADERWATGFTAYDLKDGSIRAHVSGRDKGEFDGLIWWPPDRAVGWHWDVMFVYASAQGSFQQWKKHTTAIRGCVVLGERMLSWDDAGEVRVWERGGSAQHLSLKEGINQRIVGLGSARFFAWGALGGSFWRQTGRSWLSVERAFEVEIVEAVPFREASVVAIHTDGSMWHHTEGESQRLTQLDRTDGALFRVGGAVCVVAGASLWWCDEERCGHWRAPIPIVSAISGSEGKIIINMGTQIEIRSLLWPRAASETPEESD